MNNDKSTGAHRWRFFRSGGFDQVALESADDLRHLDELDPKLWTALNCPTTGLEFDARTLQLLDNDGDGQIRVPEIQAAVRWACRMLRDPQTLFAGGDLSIDAIDASDPEGATLRTAATNVLGYLGKPADANLSVDDFSDMTRLFSPDHNNGDGVVPAALTGDPLLARVIGEIVDTQGGVPDRSGEPGATSETAKAFFEQAAAYLAWRKRGEDTAAELLPLGDTTAAASAALDAVAARIDDFFARCQLAAFDPRSAEALNPPASAYEAIGAHTIAGDDAEVRALPLARVEAGRALPLGSGVNPAWAAELAALADTVVKPLLGVRDSLTQADWQALTAKLAPYRKWMSERPDSAVCELDPAHLAAITGNDTHARIEALIAEDQRAETSAATIDAVERLVRYHRDLVTLLRNFVTLSDFYGGRQKAIFQAGTLYLDQRSCELVLRVSDMGAHANMAPFSGCYLVYCTCERAGSAPITIAAALTGGEVDELMVPGRHGVFYDRAGRDWKATVVRIVEQPVSIRQAFWSPYRRVGTFIENQIRNFAASRDKDVDSKAQAGVTEAAATAEAGKAAPPAFDIAKFAGIFAAIGLAVGAIGTALTAAISGLFALAWWQVPLVIAAVMLAISGPSMLLAFMNLRRRNLGPLLDANGWAVNARARINIPFGGSLTGVAALPPGSSRSLVDPFADKKRPWKTWLFLLVVVAGLIAAWYRGILDPLLARLGG
ncbi:MAG: hypothetical protein KF911_03140 [Pseudomonadales bacterium]|nr:hypothetical protein [Pseudomonadales bacterium]